MREDINRTFSIIEQKLKRAIENTLEKTVQYAESKLSELFKTEGASLGVEWAPLREAYLKQKLKKGYSEKKLHRTTTLAQSFTSVVRPFEAVVGTPVEYAKYHETGTRKMPKRPFMEPVLEHILKNRIPARYFKEAFR
jgi:HK97 gp10 family phage protein